MKEINEKIKNILVDNLEITDIYDTGAEVDSYSIETTSSIISKEIKDIAIEFAHFRYIYISKNYEKPICNTDIFNKFINHKYKES